MQDPRERTMVKQAEVDRAIFWYEVRLYLKVFLIVALPFALVLWGLMMVMDRI